MALAPLRTGPHTVRANRLAFAAPVPVREAGGAGHWVTVGHHGEDDEGGGVHIFISYGGTVEKGPRGLLGHHIGAVASHPGAGKVKHHPAGHEPPGARDHPHYAEAPPHAEPRTPNAGQEATKRPGKPYARLSGAEQGTRHEQIGKALSEAQGAARAAKAVQASGPSSAPVHHAAMEAAHNAKHRADTAHIAAGGTWTGGGDPRGGTRATRDAVRAQGAAWQEAHGRSSQAEHGESMRHQQTHFAAGGSFSRFGEPRGGTQQTRQALRQHRADWIPPAHAAQASTEDKDKLADTAVAHQQAQAELAAHRAAADRNPNPWAPHLSPPALDAKDKELAEKATRAQLAHQAAQAQQQGAQQQEQQEGQRAHEKEMVRLKQAGGERREAGEQPAKTPLAHEHQPGDAPELYKARNELIEAQHRWTRAKVEARTPAEHERVKLHQEMVRRLTGQVRDLEAKGQSTQPAQPEQPKKPAQAAYEALQAEVKRRQGGRPAEPTPRFSAPQTAPQSEQAAHPYEAEAHEHVAALPQAVRDTLKKAGVTVKQHQGSQAEALPGHALSTPMAKLGPADAGYDSRTGTAHFFGGKAQRYDVHHEMGHALDDALGYQTTGKHHTPYSSQPQFQALYRKHKENMDLPPPMRTNAQEMFADAFAMHHDVLHQEGETADGEPRMVHRGRKLERAAPDLRAHIAAVSEHPPGRKVRESATLAPRFSAPVASAR